MTQKLEATDPLIKMRMPEKKEETCVRSVGCQYFGNPKVDFRVFQASEKLCYIMNWMIVLILSLYHLKKKKNLTMTMNLPENDSIF